MKRIVHQLVQGSPEWHAHRRSHFNASEAPAMLGISPYQTRADLLASKVPGAVEEEVSSAKQRLFDDGHRFEAVARAWAEEIIGDDLFPVTASLVLDGLPLSSSYDGATMAESEIFEHKTLNAELREALPRGVIPDRFKPQMEQQLLVLGATRCLFMASSGDRETMLHAWYESDAAVRSRLIAGWKQFAADLSIHVPNVEAPKAVAETIETLPALVMRARGELTESNLDEYRVKALGFIASINRELSTDQHFADAAANVKFLAEGAAQLKAVKLQVQAQTKTIDEAFRTIDVVVAEMDRTRLELDKLVDARNKAIKAEIVLAGFDAFRAHLAALCKRLERRALPIAEPDFAVAIKGKRSIKAMRDAIDVALANAKIAANDVADRIDTNLKAIPTLCSQDEASLLLRDLDVLTVKAPEDFIAVVGQRVVTHRAAEVTRLEAERDKIRAEERERAAAAQQQAAAEAVRRSRTEPVQVMDNGAAIAPIERDDPSAAWQVVDAPAPAPSKGFPESVRSWAAQRLAPADTWDFDVFDIAQIPHEFLIVDRVKVIGAMTAGREIPGIVGRKVTQRAAA